MSGKTAQDRKHDFNVTLVAFLLTTVVGGLLTFFFQYFEEKHKEQASAEAALAQLTELRRAGATQLFDDVSILMDTRLFLWRRLAWSLEYGDESRIRADLDAYHEVFYKWNFRLNRNRALMCRYFGPGASDEFTEIMGDLNSLHEAMNTAWKDFQSKKSKAADLESKAEPVNPKIYKLTNELSEAIRSGKVGLSDPGNACGYTKQIFWSH